MKKVFFINFFLMAMCFCTFAQSDMLSSLPVIRTDMRTKRVSSYDETGGNRDRFERIEPNETRTLFDVGGAGIINHIWITISPGPDELSRNDIILKMYWDGNDEPSVVSPIGPFFGQGWDETYHFISLPLSAAPIKGNALVSYFQMPFADGARIEIENNTDSNINFFYFYIDYVEMDALPENMGRFHAWFNREITDAPEEGENEWSLLGAQGKNKYGEDNYVIADIKGRGHFVGVNYFVQNPSTVWYGEGDDMIFIDDNPLQTLYGTGTEDYFNTSWCPKELYSHPFYGYPRVNNETGWLGRTHAYRFHITDPLYFGKSFKFTIEHGHNNCLTLDLATVAYWYQDVAAAIPPIPNKEARKLKPLIQNYHIHRWRHEWRKSRGGGSKLWGDEKEEEK